MKSMNKTVIIFAAHPDDEVIGCGGVIAKHTSSGDKVHVVFMANGVSSRNASNQEIGDRQNAAKNAADILGISSIKQFDFLDNEMDTASLLSVVQVIESVIDELQPEIIYTHHIGDLNIDHQITHKAVMTACRPHPDSCVKEIYAFEILSSTEWQTPNALPFSPNAYFCISKQIKAKKKALEAYYAEMQDPPHSRSIKNIMRLNYLRGNSVGVDCAEAFILIRKVD